MCIVNEEQHSMLRSCHAHHCAYEFKADLASSSHHVCYPENPLSDSEGAFMRAKASGRFVSKCEQHCFEAEGLPLSDSHAAFM